MRRTLLIALMLLTIHYVRADVGETGMSFLKLGIGARALGMGDAYSAVANDPSGMHYNPATLGLTSSSQLLFMHKTWLQDVSTEYLGAQTSLGAISFGLGINSTSVADIEIRETPGAPLGSFDARNASFGLSAAYAINSELTIGVTGKFLYEKILTNEASGFGFDIGGVYTTPWDIRFAIAAINAGSMNALDQEGTKLPTAIRAGGGYETAIPSLDGAFVLATDIVSYTGEQATHIHVGSEFTYNRIVALRAGYQTGYEAGNLTLGLGVRYGSLHVDYAMSPSSDLGSGHTFSLGIVFP